MLAPSVLGGTEVFLENPDHFGTSVPVLLVLLLLEWGEGRDDVTAPRWYVPFAVGALLAWTQVGDELSLVAATVPIAAVCGFRLAVTVARRRPRIGLRRDGLRRDGLRGDGLRGDGLRRDGLLLAGALVSVALAELAERALRAAGGFDQRPIPGTRLASLGQLRGNAGALWQSLVLLFGANNPGPPKRAITISNHVPLVLSADLHVIGLVAAGAGLVAGIAAGFFGWPGPAGPPGQASNASRPSWPRRGDWADRDRVDQILVVAIGVTITAALVSTVMMQSLVNAHEIAILLPLGAALAGRTLPPSTRLLAERIVRAGAATVPTMATMTTAATVALAGWLAVGLAKAGLRATSPAAAMPVQNVAAWLVAHHQHDGLAAYWQGAETTVASGGLVLVAPVTTTGTAADNWEASSAWYQPSQYRATFVIAELHPDDSQGSLTVASVRARSARPRRVPRGRRPRPDLPVQPAQPPARPDLSRGVMITGEPTRAAPPTRPPGPRRRAAVGAALTVVVAVALFAGYLGQSRTVSVGSDGASQALQAWDMLHGNPLLHGWWVTDVSFYTTELPQYALLELVRGLTPDVMHVGGAMTYTLLVLAAAFLARGRARGHAGLTRALLAAGLMLAPQLGPGTQTLVLSPDHTGTAVPVLLVWLLVDRSRPAGTSRCWSGSPSPGSRSRTRWPSSSRCCRSPWSAPCG